MTRMGGNDRQDKFFVMEFQTLSDCRIGMFSVVSLFGTVNIITHASYLVT